MFEKEAEEYGKRISEGRKIEKGSFSELALQSAVVGFECGAEFGYELGIGRQRYCCTCKKWVECKVESMYGICADWEIKEISE